MGFRFLHLADLHLETYFGGQPETRERLRAATLEAFDRGVEYAIEHELHAVLMAGDVYDDPLLSLRTEGELIRQLRRLVDANVWCLIASGNHDPGGEPFRSADIAADLAPGGGDGARGSAPTGARVHWFRAPQPEVVTISDVEGHPVGIVVGAGHPTPTEASNLAAAFPDAASARAGATHLPVVGLLHTHVAGASAAATHDRFAPSTAFDFHRHEFDYWALGHIHARQCAAPGLPVHYAGNLQGRNWREMGSKGGLVVDADAGAPATPEFVRLAPVRWTRCSSTIPSGATRGALIDHLTRCIEAERAWPGEEVAIRMDLKGAHPLARTLRDPDELNGLGKELAARTGALEVELLGSRIALPVDREELRNTPSMLRHALDLIDRARTDDALLESIAPETLARAADHSSESVLAYLRELLADLDEEILERSLQAPEPGTGWSDA